jgi:hydrogenase maturation protease
MEQNTEIVVLGLGNILLRDEGVGVKVIEELRKRYDFLPPVKLIDGGTAGFGLVTEIEGCQKLLVVDAVKAGNEPGTVYKFRRGDITVTISQTLSVHDIGFFEALEHWKILGIEPEVIFFGIEPEDINSWGFDLTPCIQDKMPKLVALVIDQLQADGITVTKKNNMI